MQSDSIETLSDSAIGSTSETASDSMSRGESPPVILNASDAEPVSSTTNSSEEPRVDVVPDDIRVQAVPSTSRALLEQPRAIREVEENDVRFYKEF